MSNESSTEPDVPKNDPVDPTDAFDRRRHATRLAATVATDLTARAATLAAHCKAGNKRPGQGANIDEAGAVVLSIEGAWGAGKTHFIGLLKEEVETAAKAASGPTPIWHAVSIWEANDSQRVLERFLAQVETALLARPVDWRRRWWVATCIRAKRKGSAYWWATLALVALAGVAWGWVFCPKLELPPLVKVLAGYESETAFGLAIAAVWRLIKNLAPEFTNPSGPISRGALLEGETYGKMFEEVHEEDHPVYFVVDDLDRVEPALVVQILGLIRRLSRIPWLVFIVAYEPAHLHAAVTTQLGLEDAQGFLAKLTTRRFALPLPSEERFGRWASSQLLTAMKAAATTEKDGLDDAVEPLLLCLRRSRTLNAFRTPRSVLVVARRIETEWHACFPVAYQPDVLVLAILLEVGPDGTDLSVIHRLVSSQHGVKWRELASWFRVPSDQVSTDGTVGEGPFVKSQGHGAGGNWSSLKDRLVALGWWTEYHTACLTLLATLFEAEYSRGLALSLAGVGRLDSTVPSRAAHIAAGVYRFVHHPRTYSALEGSPSPRYPITIDRFLDGLKLREFNQLSALPVGDGERRDIVLQWLSDLAQSVSSDGITSVDFARLWEARASLASWCVAELELQSAGKVLTELALLLVTKRVLRDSALPPEVFVPEVAKLLVGDAAESVDLWEVWRWCGHRQPEHRSGSQQAVASNDIVCRSLSAWLRSLLLARLQQFSAPTVPSHEAERRGAGVVVTLGCFMALYGQGDAPLLDAIQEWRGTHATEATDIAILEATVLVRDSVAVASGVLAHNLLSEDPATLIGRLNAQERVWAFGRAAEISARFATAREHAASRTPPRLAAT